MSNSNKIVVFSQLSYTAPLDLKYSHTQAISVTVNPQVLFKKTKYNTVTCLKNNLVSEVMFFQQNNLK